MSPAMINLARRLVALPGWEWRPGMLTHHTERVVAVVAHQPGKMLVIDAQHGPADPNDCSAEWVRPDDGGPRLPDLTDPATLGALLGLVRERLGKQTAHLSLTATWDHDPLGGAVPVDWWEVRTTPRSYGAAVGDASTEAAALVAALRAAGRRS